MLVPPMKIKNMINPPKTENTGPTVLLAIRVAEAAIMETIIATTLTTETMGKITLIRLA